MSFKLLALTAENVTEQQVEDVYALLELMHSEIAIFPLSERKVRDRIQDCLDRGAIIAIADGDQIVASCGVLPGELWYSEQVVLTETWFFVHPDHRKSRHAAAMLKHATSTAKEANIPFLMEVFTTRNTEAKCRLFRRQATPVGEIFMTGV